MKNVNVYIIINNREPSITNPIESQVECNVTLLIFSIMNEFHDEAPPLTTPINLISMGRTQLFYNVALLYQFVLQNLPLSEKSGVKLHP